MDQLQLPIRNAGLYSAIRHFVDATFALLREDREAGADVTFSVEAHRPIGAEGKGTLYEYQPLVGAFVRERLDRIVALKETDDAAWAIASDPACATWLRAGRAELVTDLELVARDELLIPLVMALGEARPEFELDDDLLLNRYLKLEHVLYADARRYAAAVPLWGVRLVYGDLEVADGVRLRQVDQELFRMEWPEASQWNWGEDARDGLPHVMLEFERSIAPDDDPTALDPLPAVDQVVSVIRALAGGSVCAGPYVMERLDHRTLAPRPVNATASRRCGTLPSRIDATVAKTLPTALRRLAGDPNGAVARALERYEVAATSAGLPALRAAFDMLLEIYTDEREVMSAGLRMAAVVGASLPERQQFAAGMRRASLIIRSAQLADDEVASLTRLLAAALRATIAAALVGELPLSRLQDYADSVLLGERPRRQLGVAAMKPVLQRG